MDSLSRFSALGSNHGGTPAQPNSFSPIALLPVSATIVRGGIVMICMLSWQE